MKKFKSYISRHKIITIIAALGILGLGYWAYAAYTAPEDVTRYTLGKPVMGTISSVVTGSGQVSAYNTIELKSKASGDISKIYVVTGQEVKAGQLIAALDTGDALIDLENAKITYQKLTKPADASTISQAENSILTAEQSLEKSKDDLTKSYADAYSVMSSIFLDMPDILESLKNIFSETGLSDEAARNASKSAQVQRSSALTAYYVANTSYENQNKTFKKLGPASDRDDLLDMTSGLSQTLTLLAAAIRNTNSFVGLMADDSTLTNAYSTELISLSSSANTTNSNISSVISARSSITSGADSIASDERQIIEKKQALAELKQGADAFDMRSGELAYQQKQREYENYFIRAPFDGVIAKVSAKQYDSVSSATSVATLISKQWIAEISMNEVDAAKVAVGQPVKVSFDAIEELNAVGKVTDVDLIGTVTQGVVNYTVEVGFDAKDPKVKSGMSVSASITTESKENILTVPSAAIKGQGDRQYVETLDGVAVPSGRGMGTDLSIVSDQVPRRIFVTTGVTDDTQTEILSGLTADDVIITKTTLSTAAKATTQSPSLFGGARVGGQGQLRTR